MAFSPANTARGTEGIGRDLDHSFSRNTTHILGAGRDRTNTSSTSFPNTLDMPS
jgi:hypothetical protein